MPQSIFVWQMFNIYLVTFIWTFSILVKSQTTVVVVSLLQLQLSKNKTKRNENRIKVLNELTHLNLTELPAVTISSSAMPHSSCDGSIVDMLL